MRLRWLMWAIIGCLFVGWPASSSAIDNSEEASPTAPGPAAVAESAPPDEYALLRDEIFSLRLGPDASEEELRRRDEVIMKISQVDDLNARDELLMLLDEQERLAEGY